MPVGRVSQVNCQDGTGEAGGLYTFAITGEDRTCSVLFPPPQKKAPLKGDHKPTHAKKGAGLRPTVPSLTG